MKSKAVQWSGANNALWYFQNNQLNEIKSDKQPIGASDYPKPFTTHYLNNTTGTIFYLFTDGFADQFGGPKGKKFKYKQLAGLLAQWDYTRLNQQADHLNKSFDDWKGTNEQVDDVTIIGFHL